MKIQRNDPCLCGSGKKYKHCCLAAAAAGDESPDQLVWRRVRRALQGHVPQMLRFVVETYGSEAIHEAWTEFVLADTEVELFDPATPHTQLFLPWFFHCWAPDPYATTVQDKSLFDQAPTSTFLARCARGMDPTLRTYLTACAATPVSYHEVLSCNRGHGMLTRDVLTGQEHAVLERSASASMAVNDILYAQIVRVDGIAMLEASPPFGFPPINRIAIIELRDKILRGAEPFSTELLREYDIELRELYLSMVEAITNPVMPQLQNTDGDALSLQRLVFDIDSIDAVFAALKSLAHESTEADLLQSAQRDRAGALKRIQFDWSKAGNRQHPGWSNTVLGSIDITRKRLYCDVNSAERALQLRGLIEQRLGEAVRYRLTKLQSLEAALAKGAIGSGTTDPASSESERLQQDPAVQKHLRRMMVAHYDAWPSMSLPALDGATPEQAVRDTKGREKVEALLRQMERDGQRQTPAFDPLIVSRLRERLGLA